MQDGHAPLPALCDTAVGLSSLMLVKILRSQNAKSGADMESSGANRGPVEMATVPQDF